MKEVKGNKHNMVEEIGVPEGVVINKFIKELETNFRGYNSSEAKDKNENLNAKLDIIESY